MRLWKIWRKSGRINHSCVQRQHLVGMKVNDDWIKKIHLLLPHHVASHILRGCCGLLLCTADTSSSSTRTTRIKNWRSVGSPSSQFNGECGITSHQIEKIIQQYVQMRCGMNDIIHYDYIFIWNVYNCTHHNFCGSTAYIALKIIAIQLLHWRTYVLGYLLSSFCLHRRPTIDGTAEVCRSTCEICSIANP